MNDGGVSSERLSRSLRQIDWRFLTANPTPRRVLASAPGAVVEALSHVAQEVVSDPTVGRSYDLVVLRHASPREIDEAWQALTPGGHLALLDESRRLGGGHTRILRARGFERVRAVWRWPRAQDALASFWLPAKEAWSLRYLARRPSRTSSVKRSAGAAFLRIAAVTGTLPPAVLLAWKQGPPPPASADLLQALPVATPLDAVLLTGGSHASNKVVAIVAPGQDRWPRLAVKFARVPSSIPDLKREHRVLRRIDALARPSSVTLPRPRFAVPVGASFAVGTSVVDASGFALRDNARAGQSLAERVAAWLETLVDSASTPGDVWWVRLVDEPLRKFGEVSTGLIDPRVRDAVETALPALRDLPLAVEHRDCSPWNVLVGGDGRLAVLDWESADEQGLPARDLTYFLLYWAWFTTDPGQERDVVEALRAVRDESTRVGALAVRLERRYCEAAGLNPPQLMALRLLTWTHHAVSEHRRIAMDAEDGSGPPRTGLFLRLLAEEVRLQR